MKMMIPIVILVILDLAALAARAAFTASRRSQNQATAGSPNNSLSLLPDAGVRGLFAA